MTLRERIADWISGGRLTLLENDREMLRGAICKREADFQIERFRAKRLTAEVGILSYDNRNGWANSARFKAALESIAANTCCGPCQEAALVAREALGLREATAEERAAQAAALGLPPKRFPQQGEGV